MAIKHTKTAVPDVDKVDCTDWNADHTAEEDPVFTVWDKDHADLSNVTSDQHHPQSHTLASHSTKAHTELTNVTSGQHHAKSHAHDGIDGSGTVAHSDTTGRTANDHHNESHNITSHSDIVDATGANIEELTGGGDTVLHDHDGISENIAARHAQSHNAASHSDITSTGAQIDDAVSKKHDEAHTLASHSTKAHTELTGVTSDQHHAQSHTLASHSTKAHAELTNVTANQHHPQTHTIVSHDTTAFSASAISAFKSGSAIISFSNV
ncbi:hypothetical protein ES705_36302 [subsurface metagenome]